MIVCSNCKKAIGEVDFDAQIPRSICGFCISLLDVGDGIYFSVICQNVPLRDSSRASWFSSVINMPDESCRKCGGLLLEYYICGDCKEPTQLFCRICAQKTIQRYHDGYCFKVNELKISCIFALS